MIRGLALGCLLLAFSVGLRAGSEALAVSSSAGSVSPEPGLSPAEAWKDSGFEYCFGITALSVFNASPLAFTPFELGWRFSNGLQVRVGLDVFYYEGLDTDAKLPAQGVSNYSYEMRDLRSSLLYTVPLPGRLRPSAGLTLEAMGGTRKLSGPAVVNPRSLDAWGFLGTGAILGAECRLSEHWALETQGRYTFSFTSVGPVTALSLGLVRLF